MRDKAELEFERVYKKHKDLFKSVNYHYDAKNKFTHAYVQLQTGVVVYLMKFNAPTKQGTNVEVMNKFEVLRADILNGSFSNSINGFVKYGSNDKLSLLMGLGYVTGVDDIEIATPKMIGNVNAEEMMLSTVLYGWIGDSEVLYRKRETPTRKTDDPFFTKQRPAGIGAAKGKVSTFVYIVREIKSISEKSGLPIYGKLKQVSVRRVDQKSAENYVKSMYSYKKTGKLYFVELKSIK